MCTSRLHSKPLPGTSQEEALSETATKHPGDQHLPLLVSLASHHHQSSDRAHNTEELCCQVQHWSTLHEASQHDMTVLLIKPALEASTFLTALRREYL